MKSIASLAVVLLISSSQSIKILDDHPAPTFAPKYEAINKAQVEQQKMADAKSKADAEL